MVKAVPEGPQALTPPYGMCPSITDCTWLDEKVICYGAEAHPYLACLWVLAACFLHAASLDMQCLRQY